MARSGTFATKLPDDLKRQLDEVCRQFGLKKQFVVEQALREKIEDLRDAFDLEEARRTATSYRPLEEVERDLRRRRRL